MVRKGAEKYMHAKAPGRKGFLATTQRFATTLRVTSLARSAFFPALSLILQLEVSCTNKTTFLLTALPVKTFL